MSYTEAHENPEYNLILLVASDFKYEEMLYAPNWRHEQQQSSLPLSRRHIKFNHRLPLALASASLRAILFIVRCSAVLISPFLNESRS